MNDTVIQKIGEYNLPLTLNNKHEIRYHKNKYHVDVMLASLFIRNNFKVLSETKKMVKARDHLSKGGSIIIFPSGTVSTTLKFYEKMFK